VETARAAFENWLGCGVCGTRVSFRQRPARPGAPEFVSVLWPEQAWLGWRVSDTHPDCMELMVLCSQLCLTRWHEPEAMPLVAQHHRPDEPFSLLHPTERDF